MSQAEIDEIDASTRIQEPTNYKLAIKALTEKRRYYHQYIGMSRTSGMYGWGGRDLVNEVRHYFKYTRAIEYFEDKLDALT